MEHRTIGELKKILEQFPDDATWTAYEGEDTGITVKLGSIYGFIPSNAECPVENNTNQYEKE